MKIYEKFFRITAARLRLRSGKALETVGERRLNGEGEGVGAKGRAGVGEQEPVLLNLDRPVSEVVCSKQILGS